MVDVNDDTKGGGYRRVEILTGPGRRRRWSAGRRAVVMAEVARRWQVCSQQVEAKVTTAGLPVAPRLHPNLAEVYREKVARLRDALAANGGPEVLEAARALVERLEVHSPVETGSGPRAELQGHLASTRRAAGAFGSSNANSPPGVPDGLVLKVDAGTRKHLDLLLTG